MPVKLETFDITVTLNTETTPNISRQGVVVSNAGMVLMHPFAKQVFEDLGLLEGLDFISQKSRERAVCIWQYLATGRDDFLDRQMLIPKILTGYSLNKTVDPLPISEFEREVCRRHLDRLLRYWDLASDLDELRRRFFDRKGVLEKGQEGYNIYIEHKSDDDTVTGSFQSPVSVRWPWQRESLLVFWN